MVARTHTPAEVDQSRHELKHGSELLAQVLIHFRKRVRRLAAPLTPGEQAAAARLADSLEVAGLLSLNLFGVTSKAEGDEA